MKKLFLVMAIIILFSINLTLAVSPALQITTDTGLDIKPVLISTIKTNESYQFNIHVHNDTTGILMTNSTIECTLHLYNSLSGTHIFSELMDFDTDENDFVKDIGASNFTNLGEYHIIYYCNGTGVGGSAQFGFYVNKLGYDLNESISNVYITSIAFIIFLFIINTFFITRLPNSDSVDESGSILEISNLKHLRSVLYVVDWGLILAMIYIMGNLTYMYLYENLLGNLFMNLFLILSWLSLPMVIIWFIYLFVKMFRENEVKKMIERGVDIKGTP